MDETTRLEIVRLRELLAQSEHAREEADRRREEAEQVAAKSRPLSLRPYLEECHSVSLALQVVRDRSLTTQGETTDPTGRIFPKRIIPWDGFKSIQEDTWNQLSDDEWSSYETFPSSHQLSYVKQKLRPISSESGVRDFAREAIENHVQNLISAVYAREPLRKALGLQGTVTFQSHTNLGTSAPRNQAHPRPKARGKGNRADQFCIYRTSDNINVPALAIEEKAPHKLSVDEIAAGLQGEIQPERDVINKEGEGFHFASRSLVAAVVTQLFSYMIGRGLRYGYVCTGEAFIFLFIPLDDPTVVYCKTCVPNKDVIDGDETRLHRTAVAQVFAFILRAICDDIPSQTWYDTAQQQLTTWAIEYEDILSKIPATDRKPLRTSPYKAPRWTGFERSPALTRSRSRCLPLDSSHIQRESDGDDDEDDSGNSSPSPAPKQPDGKGAPGWPGESSQSRQGGGQGGRPTQHKLQERSYCTQACLHGLAFGGLLDLSCPNVGHHGASHMTQADFLSRLKTQLAKDRGVDAECVPLHLSGSRGSLFKVRLSYRGYVFVAKGLEPTDTAFLRHEQQMYTHLRPLQGSSVPVCLGTVDLELPWRYNGGTYTQFLLLSWAGQPLLHCGELNAGLIDPAINLYRKLHALCVLHGDAEPRNIVYNAQDGRLMVVDFERAEHHPPEALGSLISNGQSRKRKRTGEKVAKSIFEREMESMLACLPASST